MIYVLVAFFTESSLFFAKSKENIFVQDLKPVKARFALHH